MMESDGSAVEAEPQTKRVADLALEDKKEALKVYWENVQEDTAVGEFIDAVDSVNKWCLASVAQIVSDTYVKVHFDGWSSKWDVAYKWNSWKVAPFRRYSKGYTGQNGVPIRTHMSYD